MFNILMMERLLKLEYQKFVRLMNWFYDCII